jgi:hypothetical protein
MSVRVNVGIQTIVHVLKRAVPVNLTALKTTGIQPYFDCELVRYLAPPTQYHKIFEAVKASWATFSTLHFLCNI